MRNLSKVLALVLSLAFVLTMFAGAIDKTAAEYTDGESFSDAGKEAVAVLSALGIVNGYTDGSFQPAANVTRAEFAKMISLAMAGEDVTNFYATETLPFNDKFDSWCIPYINYCYLNELMVGYGDGYMLPANNVTGFEAVKMTLVALGYDPKVEGLEGSAWQSNTAKLANRIGLLKNLTNKNFYSAFDREATAILVRNAIYTETVEYVGGSAVDAGLTLGEKVYDLLDVRGIVVANEYTGSSLTWTDVLADGVYNKSATISYDAANGGQTRFAYRDYTGASTVGGYYVPRVITANIASDNADIGRAYRILTTGAQTPANTSEVRKVYGVIGEIASDNEYTFATSGLNAGKINAAASCFIDGSLATAEDAVALFTAQSATAVPFYYYVDNNNDGIVDTVYLYTLNVAKVLAADAENGKLTLSGVGSSVAYETKEEIVAGDYVVYGGDNQYSFAQKLTVIEGTVTGYSVNSNNTSTTEAGDTYTINGAGYSFGSLVEKIDDIDSNTAYFEGLIGDGTAALYGTTYTFVMDGSYIVAVFTTADSYWSNYAIVINSNTGDRLLGMPSIQLYTDDNEYKEFYVASYNGKQLYDYVTMDNAANLPVKDNLVRYEEIGDNTIAIYDYNYVNVNAKTTAAAKLGFNTTTGNWEDVMHAPYNWDNGVVFAGYTPANSEKITWRAYWKGEFQPTDAADFGADKDQETQLVYADGLNGVATIKAAAIKYTDASIDYLPGLVLRSDAIWGTIMSVTSVANVIDNEDAKAKYAYTVEILNPYSTSKSSVVIYADHALNTFVKGQIYKLFMSEDGVCRRFEQAGTPDNFVEGENYLELGKYLLTYAYTDGADGYYLQLKYVVNNAGTLSVEDKLVRLGADADAYFVKNLFTNGISAWNQLANTTSLGNIKLTKGLTVYADINPTTNEINSVWFDDANDPWTIKVNADVTLTSYDVNTRKAVYTMQVTNNGVLTTLTKEYTQDPDELFCNVGGTVKMTVTADYNKEGQWTLLEIEPSLKWADYDATNAQTVEWSASNMKVWTPETGNKSSVDYKITAYTNIFWFRTEWNRVDGIGGEKLNALKPADFYKTAADAAGELLKANEKASTTYLAYNADQDASALDAYNYESFSVLADKSGNAYVIVLKDNDTANAQENCFPYSNETAVEVIK